MSIPSSLFYAGSAPSRVQSEHRFCGISALFRSGPMTAGESSSPRDRTGARCQRSGRTNGGLAAKSHFVVAHRSTRRHRATERRLTNEPRPTDARAQSAGVLKGRSENPQRLCDHPQIPTLPSMRRDRHCGPPERPHYLELMCESEDMLLEESLAAECLAKFLGSNDVH